jgi:hypothetical protein
VCIISLFCPQLHVEHVCIMSLFWPQLHVEHVCIMSLFWPQLHVCFGLSCMLSTCVS